MLMRGTVHSLMRDMNNNLIISFNVGKESFDMDGDLDIKVTHHREKRTLTQNAYYWTLLSKLASKMSISTSRLHNLMLRDVAPPFVIGGKIAMQPIPDTERAENEILEMTTFHLKPTSGVIEGKDGQIYRWYIILQGSSMYDTKQMTTLLNHLVEECKEAGVETATERELEQMRKYSEELERRK